tara:strand:+ start:232 stop:1038 length:807 start_codon:yes stop_codon:yes gene_type:complete
MNKTTFENFKQLVYEKSGITLGPQKVALVTARVAKRMRALDIADHDEYLRYVIADSTTNELVHLLDSISTNVTSFFRESAHYDFLTKLIEQWQVSSQPKFRIWCAASSTGEEPYCLAITTLEALGRSHPDFRILATDISTRALEAARVGTYSNAKLEPVSAGLRQKYFTREGVGDSAEYTAKDELKRIISFNRLNLSAPPFPMKGPMDVVFCRNVMIYFDNKVRQRLLDEVVRLLKPGGYLMIGHSESLAGINVPLSVVQPAVYQKAP